MLTMGITPWILIGIVLYSVSATLITKWLASGIRWPKMPPRVTPRVLADLVAELVWLALVCVFGLLAVRYVERMTNAISGYLLFATLGFLLSWVRALLYRRIQNARQPERSVDWQIVLSLFIHSFSYLLFAMVLYLALSWLLGLEVDPVQIIPLGIGALLPDLDACDSLPGRLLPWLSRRLEKRFGHAEEWHTPAAVVLVALIALPVVWLFGAQVWYLIPLGFFSHLLLDLLSPRGVKLFWPLTRTRYSLFGGVIQAPGCYVERVIVAALALTSAVLLFTVDLSPFEPAVAPTLSYQQTLERYYSLRGRIQVFAYIQGSWQISGRPISGRFEILNASDESYIIFDRFSDKVFTAGRAGEDNVYLDRITLQNGPSVRVKPVEVHLVRQSLFEALRVIYEMQSEPGLQYIFVSGDVLMPEPQEAKGATIETDYSLTRLRKIQSHEEGHYSLHYLSAAELIQLGDLQVETADLVIAATYVTPATGPTVTPLPSPSSQAGPAK